jgi:hypothetical protein
MKRLLVMAAVAAALAGSVAFAGEVTGNGKDTGGPQHANSICTFSGLNDDFIGEGTRVQTPAFKFSGGAPAGTPGTACRGGSNPYNP